MTTSALALEGPSPLARLLEEQFVSEELAGLLELDVPVPGEIWERGLLGPLRDFLGRPGKEFRSRLVSVAWHLSGRDDAPPYELPLLVEILHAGSLIIDDIQDSSPTRRGLPSLHVTHGVASALNAGNWLYFWPQYLLRRLELEPGTELALHRLTSKTLLRCHHGQALDLSVRVYAEAQTDLPGVVAAITELKTGALMAYAARLGAVAAGAPPSRVEVLGGFGHRVGVGLQMLDDLGGVTSQRKAHKGLEDLRNGRPTWPWAWLAQQQEPGSFGRLQQLAREVAVEGRGPELLARLLKRDVGDAGREHVRRHLTGALSTLQDEVGASPLIRAVGAELERLERSYE